MLVFCTTCKERTQHLERTLPKNLADNAGCADVKFVVLDYNSPDHFSSYLQEKHAASIASGRLIVYSYKEPVSFQMAHAKNMAHRLGMREGGDILVNLDADNFTGDGFADYVSAKFEFARATEERIFLWASMIKEGPERTPRGISGRLAVTAQAFVLAGGYDEKYTTWSPDDKDFNYRLRRLGYNGMEIAREYLKAILHTDRMRFKDYKHVQTTWVEDQLPFVPDPTNNVVNNGRIGCGTVYRNFDPKPIEIEPMPTRVFGIGMHKTATTSLDVALSLLGFESAHWISAHWAKAIWRQMNETGKSLTLEQHYALSDLPIPLLYRRLDVAYPGSKFILTIRNEEDWIRSVQRHWSYEHNRFRVAWDTDPFTHRIHQLLYGQTIFNAEVFLARYRQHNAGVREYFKNRPNDLLVMDMSNGAGWTELCHFFWKPIPAVAFPKAFVTPGAPDEVLRRDPGH